VGQELAAVLGEHTQQVELVRAQLHTLAVGGDDSLGDVDLEVADAEDRLVLGCTATEYRS